MRIPRFILASVLVGAMLASLSPGNPPPPRPQSHTCCEKTESHTPLTDDCCRGGACALQCCRIIPATIDPAPQLAAIDYVIETANARPVPFHSLTDPEAIFHPPKV